MSPSTRCSNVANDGWACILLRVITWVGCLLLFFCLPITVLGDEATSAPSLLPLEGAESIDLTAYTTTARLVCEETACELRSEQSYRVHNADKLQEQVVRIASPQRPGESLPIRDVYIRDGAGDPLPPTEGDTFQNAVWEIKLAPDERKAFSLSYAQSLSASPFVRWHPILSPIESWGGAESARLTLQLPRYAVQSILLRVEPSHYHFDGIELEWQHEGAESLSGHEVILYSPPTWQRLRDLQKNDDHYALAQFYSTLSEGAERQGIPYTDPFEQILAELQAAIKDDPQNIQARGDLADLYLERSDVAPDLCLNYLLLAAQELAAIVEYQPENGQVAKRLSQTYHKAAQRAQEMDDPGGALLYLKKAAQVPNAPTPYESEELENLRLRLALDLAGRGQIREALTQVQSTVSSKTEETLFHYAPPLTGVRTRVDLQPHVRTASYEFQFYPPLAPKGRQRLQEAAQQFEALGECEVTLEPNHKENVALLEIRVPFRSPKDLRAWGQAVQETFSTAEDLIFAFVAQPWQAGLQTYEVEALPWRKEYRYKETVDLSHTKELCAQKMQYARWRLIELRDAAMEGKDTKLRERLALIALSEQRQAWDQLSSGSHWMYSVEYKDASQVAASWLLSWGQTRDLALDHHVYRWPVILRLLAGLALLALALSLFMRIRRRRRGNVSA